MTDPTLNLPAEKVGVEKPISFIKRQSAQDEEVATLSAASRVIIDQWLTKYPADQRQSAVIKALHVVQEENGGWLNKPLMNAVADYLGMPRIAVFEVATFYSMFCLTPTGRNKVNVCTNISCLLQGSEQVMQHIQTTLNIQCGETTADNRITLREVECLGACVGAPMMQVNKTYHENLTPEKIDQILAELE